MALKIQVAERRILKATQLEPGNVYTRPSGSGLYMAIHPFTDNEGDDLHAIDLSTGALCCGPNGEYVEVEATLSYIPKE